MAQLTFCTTNLITYLLMEKKKHEPGAEEIVGHPIVFGHRDVSGGL